MDFATRACLLLRVSPFPGEEEGSIVCQRVDARTHREEQQKKHSRKKRETTRKGGEKQCNRGEKVGRNDE